MTAVTHSVQNVRYDGNRCHAFEVSFILKENKHIYKIYFEYIKFKQDSCVFLIYTFKLTTNISDIFYNVDNTLLLGLSMFLTKPLMTAMKHSYSTLIRSYSELKLIGSGECKMTEQCYALIIFFLLGYNNYYVFQNTR